MFRRISNEVWLWGSVFATILLVFSIWGTAHAQPIAKPNVSTAAALIGISTTAECISESKLALEFTTAALNEGWDENEAPKHLQFPGTPVTTGEAMVHLLFAVAFTQDISQALAYLVETKAPQDEYAARTAQMILESCAYEVGVKLKRKADALKK